MGLAFPLRERFRGVIVGAVQVVIVNSYSAEVCTKGAASELYSTLPRLINATKVIECDTKEGHSQLDKCQ